MYQIRLKWYVCIGISATLHHLGLTLFACNQAQTKSSNIRAVAHQTTSKKRLLRKNQARSRFRESPTHLKQCYEHAMYRKANKQINARFQSQPQHHGKGRTKTNGDSQITKQRPSNSKQNRKHNDLDTTRAEQLQTSKIDIEGQPHQEKASSERTKQDPHLETVNPKQSREHKAADATHQRHNRQQLYPCIHWLAHMPNA